MQRFFTSGSVSLAKVTRTYADRPTHVSRADESIDMSRRGTRNPSNAARPHHQWCRLTIVLMLLYGGMASSNAQMGGGHGGRQKNQQQAPQQSAAPTPPTAVPEPWPRLDTGAILCKSRDDLVRHQMQIAAGPSVAAPGPTPDCGIIQKQTAIQILDRDGLSRTHVVLTDETKQTGWTDSYLPSTPPPSVATSANAGK